MESDSKKKTYTELAFSRIGQKLRTNDDYVVLIDGREGAGKSTLAIKLALAAFPDFDINKDIVYTFDDLQKRLMELENINSKYQCLILDEAVEVAFSRNAMTRQQKNIVQLFMQIRERNLCFIMLIPNINFLEKFFKQHRGKVFIHVERRGFFTAFELQDRVFKDPWWNPKWRDVFSKLEDEVEKVYREVKKEAIKRKIENRKYKKKNQPKKKCKHCGHTWPIREKRNPNATARCPKCGKAV